MSDSIPHSDLGLLAESISPGGYTPTWPEAALLADAYNSLVERLEIYERALDKIAEGAADNDHATHCANWRRIAKVALRKRSNSAKELPANMRQRQDSDPVEPDPAKEHSDG